MQGIIMLHVFIEELKATTVKPAYENLHFSKLASKCSYIIGVYWEIRVFRVSNLNEHKPSCISVYLK